MPNYVLFLYTGNDHKFIKLIKRGVMQRTLASGI